MSSSSGLWLAAEGLMKALLELPCGFAPLPWEPGAQGSSLDPSRRCKKLRGAMGEAGFNSTGGL